MFKRIGLLGALLMLAFPALAGARVVLDQSIAGVNLGEAKAAVHQHLGKPTKIVSSMGMTDWVYKGRALLVGFKNGHVVEVFTENKSQRTASGIGVGSSIASVTSHIKGVTCQHVPPHPGQECIVGVRKGANDWTTDFHVGPGGHVQSVLVNILAGTGGALDRALARQL